MLQATKSISLTGKSMIGNQAVANFTANIHTPDSSDSDTSNTYIVNRELYNANKATVRKDQQDFNNLVYDAQDEVAATDTIE